MWESKVPKNNDTTIELEPGSTIIDQGSGSGSGCGCGCWGNATLVTLKKWGGGNEKSNFDRVVSVAWNHF